MTIIIFIILVAIALAGAATYLRRRSKTEPAGWFAGPIIDGKDYSIPMDIDAAGSFTFPTEAPGLHYGTKKTAPLAGKTKLVMHYKIEADAGVEFHPVTDPPGLAIGPTLYFQRDGDKLQEDGWRWWATPYAVMPIVPGEFTIEVPLTPEAWTSVQTMTGLSNPDMFALALQHTVRVGHTWGGGSDPHAGYGHGVFATGRAKLTMLGFYAV